MELAKNLDGTFTLTLTEAELDIVRTPLGRIVGQHTLLHRQVTTEFYHKAQAALGYLDEVRAYSNYLEAHPVTGSAHHYDTDWV